MEKILNGLMLKLSKKLFNQILIKGLTNFNPLKLKILYNKNKKGVF